MSDFIFFVIKFIDELITLKIFQFEFQVSLLKTMRNETYILPR